MMTTTPKKIEATLATLESGVAALRAELAALVPRGGIATSPPVPPRMPRGTADVTAEARAASRPDARARVEACLRERGRTHDELVTDAQASAGAVARALRVLRAEKRIHNIGTDERPRWHWITDDELGDETGAPELMLAVERLIRTRPMTLQELSDTTGARRNRISGVIVRLQLAGKRVENRGDARRALWYIARR